MLVFDLPVDGPITQEWSTDHPAVDIACVTGEEVRAVHGGQLTHYYNSRMGWVAVVTAPDGLRTTYSHLYRVDHNKTVAKGEVIAACGNTGSWSTGPHVHFESNRSFTF